jgi:site-specific recombinase XerD
MNQNLLLLDRLINEAHQQLEHLGYHPTTRKKYRGVWQALLNWSQEHGVQTMSLDVANQFLEYLGIPPGRNTSKLLYPYQRAIRSAVYALDDFAIHGYWRYNRQQVVKEAVFPPAFETAVKAFLDYRRIECGLSPQTLYTTKRYLVLFTSFMESNNIKNWTGLRPENLQAFFASQMHLQPKALATAVSIFRKFLRYLWLQKIVPGDLSLYLPQVKFQRRHPIPSVWRQEDVEALLAAVDRGSALGKRDYAILILVTRLGLRAGEIRTLKLEHIHWEQAEIELFQPKTKKIVLLPLSEEVGQVLIDYIRNGRPPITCREVFVRHLAPFEPFSDCNNLHHIVSAYRKKAHIPAEIPNRQGLHSLRSTLATRLLEQGTPLETIAAILGHSSQETTRIYTKVDLESLRAAALDPEEICHE